MTTEPGGLTLRVDGRQGLSAELVAALGGVCDAVEDRGGDVIVSITVSGAPREPLDGNLTVALVNKWERALRRLERLPAVTMALVSGECGGLALEALLATDYRIATPSARFLVPVVAGATWPGMVLHRLVQQAGAAGVRRAVLFGRPIEAGEAAAMGLIDELAVDPPGALAAAAELVAAFSGGELAIRRQLILDASAVSFEEALGVHLAACDRLLRHASARTPS